MGPGSSSPPTSPYLLSASWVTDGTGHPFSSQGDQAVISPWYRKQKRGLKTTFSQGRISIGVSTEVSVSLWIIIDTFVSSMIEWTIDRRNLRLPSQRPQRLAVWGRIARAAAQTAMKGYYLSGISLGPRAPVMMLITLGEFAPPDFGLHPLFSFNRLSLIKKVISSLFSWM